MPTQPINDQDVSQFLQFLNHVFGSTQGICVMPIQCVKDQATEQYSYFRNHAFQNAKGECGP